MTGPRAQGAGRGMVTAELAVAILAALTLVAMLCGGIGVLVLQMRCVDTAAEVARQQARGDRAAVRDAEREAPRGARVTTSRSGDLVRVEVRLRARPMALLPSVDLRARAEVVAEPGEGG